MAAAIFDKIRPNNYAQTEKGSDTSNHDLYCRMWCLPRMQPHGMGTILYNNTIIQRDRSSRILTESEKEKNCLLMGLAMPRSGATVGGGGGDQRLSWSYQCSLFMFMNLNEWSIGTQNKKSAIEIDLSIWREEIGNTNRLVNLAGR